MTAPVSDYDESYDEIERAVQETARGRWFLAEHARRVRAMESDGVIATLQRIETGIAALSMAPPVAAQPVAPHTPQKPRSAGSNAPIDVLMQRLATALAETGETMRAESQSAPPALIEASLEHLDTLTTEERLRLFY